MENREDRMYIRANGKYILVTDGRIKNIVNGKSGVLKLYVLFYTLVA